jgi:nondiscriminating aspartyl-tRNA synthetase
MYFIEPRTQVNPDITTSLEFPARRGEKITVQGFVHRIRCLGGANFVVLRDGEGVIQVFAETNTPGWQQLKEGYIIKVTGLCKYEERAPNGFEIVAEKIEVLIAPPEELPLTINKSNLNLHLDIDIGNRPITLRHLKYRSLFKIQEGLARGFREFLITQGFTEIFTPKIIGTGTEGGANIFSLDYFGKPAFLAQSPQFYKQMMVGVFGRVFEVCPVFRAEPHDTARHINEYVSLNLEIGFINSFTDIMAMETACLKSMFELLKTQYSQHIQALQISLPETSQIPVLHVRKAHELVLQNTGKDFRGKGELNSQEEQLLGKIMNDKFGAELVFVTHYSSEVRPFYAMDDPENPGETLTFDLLFRGVEITTGGQRIHNYDTLLAKMNARGMNPENLKDYLTIFRYGMPPHGGLGMGLERLTAWLAGYQNIRYGCLFPRDILRLTP